MPRWIGIYPSTKRMASLQSLRFSKAEKRASRYGAGLGLERPRTSIATDRDSTYTDDQFNRRFRINRGRFDEICDALDRRSPYIQTRKDATGLFRFNVKQKATAALRMILYGISGDALDEYLRMGYLTAVQRLKEFAMCVLECVVPTYLRAPNKEETKILLQRAESLRLPGMLGSIDCCKWQRNNFQTENHGQ